MPRYVEGLDVQGLLVVGSLVLYPLLILAWSYGYLVSPLLAGAMLAAATLAGPRPLCPVKVGALHGMLAVAVLLAGGFFPSRGLLEALVALAYYSSTPSALSGAVVLAVWRLQSLRLAGQA